MGHLLGRQHVFTGSEAGPFYDHLANYGSYPYGILGQLGVNTLTNWVYPPQGQMDIMTYREWKWISASAYAALLSIEDERRAPHVERPREEHFGQILLLSLVVGRNRLVTRRPSFHDPARARRRRCRSPASRSG